MNESINRVADKHKLSEQADIYDLYERSVQNVEHEIDFIRLTYEKVRGKTAYLCREDFCGTANSSCEWIKQGEAFQAIGVDYDKSVLKWSEENRFKKLSKSQRQRLTILQEDVMKVKAPVTDILTAFNFSYFVFTTRRNLKDYFKRSLVALKTDGIFFLDIFGGPEAHQKLEERTEHDEFTYIWSQSEFHPLTNFIRCKISFEFPDKSSINNAFTYDWRLWTAPEIKELLIEAGFRKVTFFWEGEDEEGEGNGEFSPNNQGEADLAWIAYIVAEK